MPKQPGQGGIMGMMMPLAIFIVIFYFLILRPQKKRQQEHDKLVSSIKIGDTVVTAGGFYGKVHDVLDDSYIIELDENVKARILKSSVSSKILSEKPAEHRKKKKKKRPVSSEQVSEAIPAPVPHSEGVSTSDSAEKETKEEN